MSKAQAAAAPVSLSDGIRLSSGLMFDYDDPGACPVTIEDIAQALSNVCRFAGHIPHFYSVAQHAWNVSRIVPAEHALTALLHDTAEAFTNDLPTPLKAAVPVFRELDERIEQAMAARFGFAFPLPPEVRLADARMLRIEKEDLKGDRSEWECLAGIDVPLALRARVSLNEWAPRVARHMFLSRFRELTGWPAR